MPEVYKHQSRTLSEDTTISSLKCALIDITKIISKFFGDSCAITYHIIPELIEMGNTLVHKTSCESGTFC